MDDGVEHVIYEKNEDIGGYEYVLSNVPKPPLISRFSKDLVRESLSWCHV
jgi:hypothetical protein